MSAHYLLVDGHSVIFAWSDLRTLHQRNRSSARQLLIQILQQFHDTTSWRVTLVMDGTHGTVVKSPKRRPEDMVVAYATADQTADSIIEKLVAASGKAPEIVVVTADEAEKLIVESLGAFTVSPDWLREEIDRQGSNFTQQLDRVHQSARWKR